MFLELILTSPADLFVSTFLSDFQEERAKLKERTAAYEKEPLVRGKGHTKPDMIKPCVLKVDNHISYGW